MCGTWRTSGYDWFGNYRVHFSFYLTSVGWKLGLKQKFACRFPLISISEIASRTPVRCWSAWGRLYQKQIIWNFICNFYIQILLFYKIFLSRMDSLIFMSGCICLTLLLLHGPVSIFWPVEKIPPSFNVAKPLRKLHDCPQLILGI